jgi:hypothetical protein
MIAITAQPCSKYGIRDNNSGTACECVATPPETHPLAMAWKHKPQVCIMFCVDVVGVRYMYRT